MSRNRMYQTWANMIARCEGKSLKSYKNYGGRGITVCERWRSSFDAFYCDMGEKPPGMTLDRIDVNGNYEPKNCRWATREEQARNTRRARIVTIDSVQYHVAELEEKYGVNTKTIFYRASLGWPFEKIVSKERFYNNSESQKKAVAIHAEMKRAQTHCKYGHELTEENVYKYKGHRACRKCRKAMDKFLYYGKQRPFTDFL